MLLIICLKAESGRRKGGIDKRVRCVSIRASHSKVKVGGGGFDAYHRVGTMRILSYLYHIISWMAHRSTYIHVTRGWERRGGDKELKGKEDTKMEHRTST